MYHVARNRTGTFYLDTFKKITINCEGTEITWGRCRKPFSVTVEIISKILGDLESSRRSRTTLDEAREGTLETTLDSPGEPSVWLVEPLELGVLQRAVSLTCAK